MALCTVLATIVLAAAVDMTGKWEVEFTFDDSNIPGGGIDFALTSKTANS